MTRVRLIAKIAASGLAFLAMTILFAFAIPQARAADRNPYQDCLNERDKDNKLKNRPEQCMKLLHAMIAEEEAKRRTVWASSNADRAEFEKAEANYRNCLDMAYFKESGLKPEECESGSGETKKVAGVEVAFGYGGKPISYWNDFIKGKDPAYYAWVEKRRELEAANRGEVPTELDGLRSGKGTITHYGATGDEAAKNAAKDSIVQTLKAAKQEEYQKCATDFAGLLSSFIADVKKYKNDESWWKRNVSASKDLLDFYSCLGAAPIITYELLLSWGSSKYICILDNLNDFKSYDNLYPKLGGDSPEGIWGRTNLKAMECQGALNALEGFEGGFDDADLYSWTSDDGKNTFYFKRTGNTYASVSGASQGCMPMPVKLLENKSCFFCPLFKVLFAVVQDAATGAPGAGGREARNAVIIAMAVFIAIRLLPHMSSFTKQEAPKLISELLVQAFKVLLVWLLLTYSDFVYGRIITPILMAGLEFGQALLQTSGENAGRACVFASTTAKGVFPPALFQDLMCFIEHVQREISLSRSIGEMLVCLAFKPELWSIMMHFTYLATGAAFCIFSWLMLFSFGFYLVDAVIRLAILGTLMPLLIACWPFGPVRGYTKKGWDMFMNVFFTFVLMALVVTVAIRLMAAGIGGESSLDTLMEAFNSDSPDKLAKLMDFGFFQFCVFIAGCVLGWEMIGQVESLAGQFHGGGIGGIGAKLGGLAASAAKGAAKFAGKTGAGVATGGAGAALSKGGAGAGKAAEKLANSKFGKTRLGKFVGKAIQTTGGAMQRAGNASTNASLKHGNAASGLIGAAAKGAAGKAGNALKQAAKNPGEAAKNLGKGALRAGAAVATGGLSEAARAGVNTVRDSIAKPEGGKDGEDKKGDDKGGKPEEKKPEEKK